MRLHVDCNIDARVFPLLKLLVKFGKGYKYVAALPEEDEELIGQLTEDEKYDEAREVLRKAEKKWGRSILVSAAEMQIDFSAWVPEKDENYS